MTKVILLFFLLIMNEMMHTHHSSNTFNNNSIYTMMITHIQKNLWNYGRPPEIGCRYPAATVSTVPTSSSSSNVFLHSAGAFPNLTK